MPHIGRLLFPEPRAGGRPKDVRSMNRPSPPDEELIDQYLRGNREAFHQLFTRYKNGILIIVRHYFHNRERAEEVFQEVFLKLIERIDYYNGTGSFRSWFYTLCRNHCIDRIRYQARRPEVVESGFIKFEEDDPTPLSKATAVDPPADLQAYDRELAAHLEAALKKLPEEQRETFLLKEKGGLTFEEISHLHRVSVNTVKSRMRYALEALRRSLKGKSFVKEALS